MLRASFHQKDQQNPFSGQNIKAIEIQNNVIILDCLPAMFSNVLLVLSLYTSQIIKRGGSVSGLLTFSPVIILSLVMMLCDHNVR